MKLLSLICATLLLWGARGIAMEQPPQVEDVEITMKHLLLNNNQHEIKFFDNTLMVGHINYTLNKSEPTKWHIITFRVHRDYRKHTLGLALFKECMDDIKSQGATVLEWEAQPQDHIITLDTLIYIYKRIIEKLNFSPDALFIGKPKLNSVNKVKMRLQL
ncbi:hypothetical protein BH09DEP1_BH09DEP1_6190 [soil metagenome]